MESEETQVKEPVSRVLVSHTTLMQRGAEVEAEGQGSSSTYENQPSDLRQRSNKDIWNLTRGRPMTRYSTQKPGVTPHRSLRGQRQRDHSTATKNKRELIREDVLDHRYLQHEILQPCSQYLRCRHNK